MALYFKANGVAGKLTGSIKLEEVAPYSRLLSGGSQYLNS